jgi:hypothetical protein
MDLEALIKENRSSLKKNSLNAYLIALKKLNDNKEIENLDFLNERFKIKNKLKKLALTTKKNYVTAILVGLQSLKKQDMGLIDFYRNLLDIYNTEYIKLRSSNSKTEKEAKNWMSLKDLEKIRNNIFKTIQDFQILEKETLNKKQFNLLQDYLIASLFTYLPPVRLDYAPMYIIKDIKDLEDNKNYLLNSGRNKKKFIIQEFKTSKTHKKIELEIPKKLNTIINLWLKYNKTNNFLINSQNKVMSANGLGKQLSRIFTCNNKVATLNLIRHIYITEKVDLQKIKDNKELAKKMGHNTNTQEQYCRI